ncbi:MAG: hypothetical protein ACR2H1_04185, partial [Limisphaerales bacterium]
HPGRDRERGRIWRIIYRGEKISRANVAQASSLPVAKIPASRSARQDASKSAGRMPALQSLALPADVKGIVAELGDVNITRRMFAMNWLVDEIGKPSIKPVQKMMRDKKSNSFQKIHGLWILHRLGELDEKILSAAAKDSDRDVRVHAMRVLSETVNWNSKQQETALAGLQDSDAYAQRAAADALGLHPKFENIPPLLTLRQKVSTEDSQLLHVVRMALRNQLWPPENFDRFKKTNLSEADSRTIADVAIGIKSESAGTFLLQHVKKFSEDREKLSNYLRHAARYAPESQTSQLAHFTRAKFADDLDFQLALWKAVQEGLAQRGAKLTASLRDWGAELAEKLLASVDVNSLDWRNAPLNKNNDSANPWFLEARASADGDKSSQFISSLSPGGEKLTGLLRSKNFTIPGKLSFFMAGHDGSPDRGPRKKI